MNPKDKLLFGLSGSSPKINQKAVKLHALMELVLKDAKKRREDAGYSGRHDDGGARELEEQVKFFNLGWNAATTPEPSIQIPESWKKYEIQLDPEYEQYKKLKAKFGDR